MFSCIYWCVFQKCLWIYNWVHFLKEMFVLYTVKSEQSWASCYYNQQIFQLYIFKCILYTKLSQNTHINPFRFKKSVLISKYSWVDKKKTCNVSGITFYVSCVTFLVVTVTSQTYATWFDKKTRWWLSRTPGSASK